MNLIQITPGAGGMYCGGCFRDNALVSALRQLGHEVLMVPLYLPLTLDEPDQSRGTPTFFGGINVYLEQKSRLFRRAPQWLHRALDAPRLLRYAGKLGARTRAEDVGDLTLSMLRGEEGNQARELRELIAWLRTQRPPDVICLSNVLLIGLARELRRELRAPVVCLLSGEDTFLDALPTPLRQPAWDVIAQRARDVDLFIAPSRYYSDLMGQRLSLQPERLRVVANGITLDGFLPPPRAQASAAAEPDNSKPAPPRAAPSVGYFARMCREKGLELLAQTFVTLRERGRVPGLRLKIGGGLGPSDEPLVQSLRARFAQLGLASDVEWHPNLDRAHKIEFLRSLDVFCTPALYGEAFGLYVIEALAAGVPVVQPRHAAFPELLEATGGGLIAEPHAHGLTERLEELLLDPARARALGEAGRRAVCEHFSSEAMARRIAAQFAEVRGSAHPPAAPPPFATHSR